MRFVLLRSLVAVDELRYFGTPQHKATDELREIEVDGFYEYFSEWRKF